MIFESSVLCRMLLFFCHKVKMSEIKESLLDNFVEMGYSLSSGVKRLRLFWDFQLRDILFRKGRSNFLL